MVHGLDAHVLTVDANVLNKVDTGNLDNLYSMWTGELSLWILWQWHHLCDM